MGSMTDNLVQGISPEWQSWVLDALSRGCSIEEMIQCMVRDGRYSRAVAGAAINQAVPVVRGQAPFVPAATRPFLDPSKNTISTPDREVSVLLSVESPRIAVLGNVLSDEECDALIAHSEARMKRCTVISDEEGTDKLVAERTSDGYMLQRGEFEIAARVEARLAAIANWPVEKGEGLQVLRYGVGAEYKPHYDWFDSAKPGQAKHLERAGQRVGTFVIYLNDVEAGGGTLFPMLGLEVAPKKGGAVFFCNVDAQGIPDQLTLHGGSPVVSGVKFVANKWLRDRTF